MGTLWQHPDQVLVNTLGHLAGVLVFGIFLVLLVRQGRACRPHQARLPLVAATLAFLWNLASLAVLSVRDTSGRWSEIFAALGFSVLSLLPAVLFDLSLRGKWPRMAQVSYALSVFAISLHLSELYSDVADLHRIALALITVGFGALTAWASVRILRTATAEERSETPRLLATMALFLFAVSFVHFAEGHAQHAWSSELAFHHAGIPLALFVLLQDFRFVLLDAFLRFLTNGLLAVLFSVLLIAGATWTLAEPRDAFQQGLLLAAGCLLLILFALVRSGAQRLLTRLVFRQPDPELATQRIRQLAADSPDEPAFLLQASQFVAGLMAANLIDMPETSSLPRNLVAPAMASAAAPGLEPHGVVAIVPVRLAQEEPHLILLGARRGGRRYLSEDLNVLARLAAQIAEQIEILRDGELRRLVSQAELKALQAQIHP
ncbi:MAG: hypothetical protein IPM24_27625, partial [Bryobacterales bacterium]|nr:hypothetical protein [Bryobacterales bacterium]